MERKKGYLFLLLTFVIWGSLYVVSKYALAQIPPITVLLGRYLVSVAVLTALMKIKGCRKQVKKEHWKYFLIIGGLGYFVSIGCQLVGTSLLDASLASLINAMNPITISVLAAVILKEKITGKNAVSIFLSVIGVYIILGVGGGNISFWGILASAGSVLFWSLASVFIRKIADEYDSVQIALYGMVIALICNIPAAAAELMVKPCTFSLVSVSACLYLGLVGTAVAHTLWNKSIKILNASTCSMWYPLQPLVSALLGILLLHEAVTPQFAVGGMLICVGILITVAPPVGFGFLPLNFFKKK